jgi:glycosyltransferase involved in cell wall biosynthesis
MASPRISVVIPCYNLGAYVHEAVDSVLAQTLDDLEIIVINDGSTDPHTVDVLSTLDRPKTRVITTENRGLAAARNLGIRASTGRYLCALDADDLLVPTYFERAVPILDATPELAFVSTWLENFGDEQWLWKQDRCDLPALLAECTVSTASLVRRSAVQAVGGFDEKMPAQGYEDWDLWISLVEKGFTGTILPEALFRYRRRAGSMSSVCCVGDTHLALTRYMIEKHRTSYETHLEDVLRRKDCDTADLLRTNDELEREIRTFFVPVLEHRREEVERLTARLAAVEARHQRDIRHDELSARVRELGAALEADRARLRHLEAALAGAAAEVQALRNSKSWKLTAPVRTLQDLLTRLVGRP